MAITAEVLDDIRSKALQAYQANRKLVKHQLSHAKGEEEKKLADQYQTQLNGYFESFIEAVKAYISNPEQAREEARKIYHGATREVLYTTMEVLYIKDEAERDKSFEEEYSQLLAKKIETLTTSPALRALPIEQPDYSFLLKTLSHPAIKIGAAILVIAGLAALAAGTMGIGGVIAGLVGAAAIAAIVIGASTAGVSGGTLAAGFFASRAQAVKSDEPPAGLNGGTPPVM